MSLKKRNEWYVLVSCVLVVLYSYWWIVLCRW